MGISLLEAIYKISIFSILSGSLISHRMLMDNYLGGSSILQLMAHLSYDKYSRGTRVINLELSTDQLEGAYSCLSSSAANLWMSS
jgi:hypothetical protein